MSSFIGVRRVSNPSSSSSCGTSSSWFLVKAGTNVSEFLADFPFLMGAGSSKLDLVLEGGYSCVLTNLLSLLTISDFTVPAFDRATLANNILLRLCLLSIVTKSLTNKVYSNNYGYEYLSIILCGTCLPHLVFFQMVSAMFSRETDTLIFGRLNDELFIRLSLCFPAYENRFLSSNFGR